MQISHYFDRKSTGVTNNLKDGSVPLQCTTAGKLLQLNGMRPLLINMINYPCTFPTAMYQNVLPLMSNCELKLTHRGTVVVPCLHNLMSAAAHFRFILRATPRTNYVAGVLWLATVC